MLWLTINLYLVKFKLGIDDTLDIAAQHAVGGIVGLLANVCVKTPTFESSASLHTVAPGFLCHQRRYKIRWSQLQCPRGIPRPQLEAIVYSGPIYICRGFIYLCRDCSHCSALQLLTWLGFTIHRGRWSSWYGWYGGMEIPPPLYCIMAYTTFSDWRICEWLYRSPSWVHRLGGRFDQVHKYNGRHAPCHWWSSQTPRYPSPFPKEERTPGKIWYTTARNPSLVYREPWYGTILKHSFRSL